MEDTTLKPMDLTKSCHILACPDEILLHIIAYLPLSKRLDARLLCKQIRRVVESQLATVRSIDISGKSVKSLLDFVKDTKAREVQCQSNDHRIDGHDSLKKVNSFQRVAFLIKNYFHHLVFIRIHKVTLTMEGIQALAASPCWNLIEHITIRSCYLANCDLDSAVLDELQVPPQMKHFNFITITNNEKLSTIFKHLTKNLRETTEPNVINVIV